VRLHPILQDEKPGSGRKFQVLAHMEMPENEIVDMPSRGEIHREPVQRLIGALEYIFLTLRHPALLGTPLAETERDVRMEKAEYTLEELVTESPAHQFVPFVSRPESVSVTEAEDFPSYLGDVRLLENLDTEILEIMEAPDVMVALEKADLHPGVHQIHQGGEHPDIPFRDNIMVLVPEIPDVPKKVQGLCSILRDGLQETDETRFPVGGIVHVQAKVDIRNKVNERSVSHDVL
jgi:hypothetical protein